MDVREVYFNNGDLCILERIAECVGVMCEGTGVNDYSGIGSDIVLNVINKCSFMIGLEAVNGETVFGCDLS